VLRSIAVFVACALALPAHADKAPAPALAAKLVAIAPLVTLDTEDTSAPIKKLTAALEAAIGTLPGYRVVSAAQVADAIKKAKKPQLRACEGEATCISELGKLVGANLVIAGQIGGLGESRIVYLTATDVAAAKELRSTSLALGANDDQTGAAGAVVRLLEPSKHRGTLHFAIDVNGTTIYVNGTRAKLTATNDLSLEVGTQAIRVTHPEYRDFVRFIDVPYGKTVDVAVGMTQYPIVRRDIQGNPIQRDKQLVVEPPIYRRWYVVGGGALLLAIVSGVIVSSVVNDLPKTPCRIVGSMDDC
jgi:hypothetical protein